MVRLAVDCMGGDAGPRVILPAVASFMRHSTDVQLHLVGRTDEIHSYLRPYGLEEGPNLILHEASQVVGMDESPAIALRVKRDSSMRRSINLVHSREVDVCLSAGNTGALMAMSRFVLKTLPGVSRPAIANMVPSMAGGTLILDLGANVDCTAQQLFQFAHMGSALYSAIYDVPTPTVGLLNIGTEEMKGPLQVREAMQLLSASKLNFVGNIEGDTIYTGATQVVVCDGFVGNIVLKVSEGLAKYFSDNLRREFSRNLFTKMVGAMALPILRGFRRRYDHRLYNGGFLLGLNGLVVKSHGSADAVAFEAALTRCVEIVRTELLGRVHQQFLEFTGT